MMQNGRIKSSGDLLDVDFGLFLLLGRGIIAMLAPREASPAPQEPLWLLRGARLDSWDPLWGSRVVLYVAKPHMSNGF